MAETLPPQQEIAKNIKLLADGSKDFNDNVTELKEAIKTLSEKVDGFEFKLDGQQRNLEKLHAIILERVSKVNDELSKMKRDYDHSINLIQTSSKSFETSANVLSSAVGRIDKETGELAKSSEVNNIVSANVNKAQLELMNMLVSKSDLAGIQRELETKIKSAGNATWIQFVILITTLLLSSLGIVGTFMPLIREGHQANMSVEQKVQSQSTSQAEPTRK